MTFIKVAKYLFFLLVFLMPVNLGKHYVLRDSYVYGIRVDYLIPTVYVQDILVCLILFFWIGGILVNRESLRVKLLKRKYQIIWLFIFSLLLSVFSSVRLVPSMVNLARIFIYSMITVFISTEMHFKRDYKKFIKVSFVSVMFLSVLGIVQGINQKSVFDNYMYFGEQPYSVKTKGLTKEYILGSTFIPPYGLFRHPNTFSGYITIFVILFAGFLIKYARSPLSA